MKIRNAVMLLILASTTRFALPQTADWSTPQQPALSAARCQYTPAEKICGAPAPRCQGVDHRPGSPTFPRAALRQCTMAAPRPSYPPPFLQFDDGHHAAIGAMIGFGIGAAAGATAKTDSGGRVVAALFGGGLGALFGAAVGHAIAPFHGHHYHRDPWYDDEETAIRRGAPIPAITEQHSTRQTASMDQAPIAPPSNHGDRASTP